MIDRFSRWPEAIPISEISADTVTTTFYSHWVARYGTPHSITTDQGPQFEAALFKALTNLIGCKRIRTSAYHPASNGILERWHRTLKSAIMCHRNENWVEILPIVLLGLRTCFKEDLKSSPAELLYGSTLHIPGEFFIEEDPPSDPKMFVEKHRINMRNIKSRPTAHHCKKSPFYHKNLFDCTHVWIRDDSVHKALQPPYSEPFRVINRINNHLFNVDVAGKFVNISTERLKPAFLPKDPDPSLILPASFPVSSSTQNTLKTYPGPKKKVQFATSDVARGGVL
jgi:cleavage and polyadenylation specificity factor subunit 1